MLTPEQFHRVYPRYSELIDIKSRLDPDGLFTSDLARRVGLDTTPTTSGDAHDVLTDTAEASA